MSKRTWSGGHIYSVFATTASADKMVYFGTSEFSAKAALSNAIMHHADVLSVALRRDCLPLLSVTVEHRQEFIVK